MPRPQQFAHYSHTIRNIVGATFSMASNTLVKTTAHNVEPSRSQIREPSMRSPGSTCSIRFHRNGCSGEQIRQGLQHRPMDRAARSVYATSRDAILASDVSPVIVSSCVGADASDLGLGLHSISQPHAIKGTRNLPLFREEPKGAAYVTMAHKGESRT